MKPFLFFIAILGSSAGFILLHFLISILRIWLQAKRIKQSGVEAEAIILHAQVMNEPDRYFPFVKLKVAVKPANESSFIAGIESFFAPDELPALTTNTSITVRYNPSNISQLQLVKRPQPIKEDLVRWQPVSAKAYLSMVQ